MSDPHGPFHSTFGDLPSATERVELNRTLAVGLAEASKVVVLDTNKDLSGKRFDVNRTTLDLLSRGRAFTFDGVNDIVLVTQSAVFDPGTGDFSLEVIFRADSFRADLDALLGQGRASTDNNKWVMTIVASKMGVYLKSASTIHVNNLDFGGSALNTGQWYHGIVTFDRSGNATGYLDGVAEPTVRSISASDGDNMVMTSDMSIGAFKYPSTTRHFGGGIALVRCWNRLLSAVEVSDFASGMSVAFADIDASQTELMPNQVDRDFSGASAWTDVNMNAYDETGDLTLTANAADQYVTLAVSSAPMSQHKRYRLEFDVANLVSTWAIKDFTGAQTLGTISSNGNTQFIEFVMDSALTGGLRLVAVASDSSADFDNFSLMAIGCVAQYEQDGITSSVWYDKSGNGLNGTVTGAAAYNLENPGEAVGVTFTVGAANAATVNVAVQFTDAAGNNVTHAVAGIMYLADDTSGLIFTTTAPDGTPVIGTDGAVVAIVTDKTFVFNTEVTGSLDYDVKHTGGARDWYMVIVLPNGRLAVSSKIEIT